jgi:hypothetical protein
MHVIDVTELLLSDHDDLCITTEFYLNFASMELGSIISAAFHRLDWDWNLGLDPFIPFSHRGAFRKRQGYVPGRRTNRRLLLLLMLLWADSEYSTSLVREVPHSVLFQLALSERTSYFQVLVLPFLSTT